MEILGRPYVFGDPEQSEWIRRTYWKEDLQNQIVEGLQQAFEGIDEYVYAFTSDDELQATVKHAVDKLKYIGGVTWHEKLEAEKNSDEGMYIKWEQGKKKRKTKKEESNV